MKVVACIFARGGSKGVPRKNVRLLGGRPLIGHAIEAARASTLVDRVLVSTDDEEIAGVARRFGAEVPFMRPAELATDQASEWLAWKHAAQYLRAEPGGGHVAAFVSVPTTSPLRTSQDVDAAIRAYDPDTTDAVITVREAQRNPYFNMVRVDPDGYARVVMRSWGRRTDLPAGQSCQSFRCHHRRRRGGPRLYPWRAASFFPAGSKPLRCRPHGRLISIPRMT